MPNSDKITIRDQTITVTIPKTIRTEPISGQKNKSISIIGEPLYAPSFVVDIPCNL